MIQTIKASALATAILTVAVPVKADWVVIVGQGTESTFSVENKAFLRNGSQRQFWAISNMGKAPKDLMGKPVRSAVVLHETDCTTKTWKVLYMRLHTERDGNGSIASESSMPFDANIGDAEKRVISYICSL